MDILREVGTTTAAHGSIVLSEIMGKRINLKVPSLNIVPTKEILNKLPLGQMVIVVSNRILTGLTGEILFVLDEKNAFKLIDVCCTMATAEENKGILTEIGISTIKEVGNMVISSYIGALSIILKTLIIISIPTLSSGPLQQIIKAAIYPYEDNDFVVVEAMFEAKTVNIIGSFYLILNAEATKYIQEACKKLLDSL